MIYFLSLFFSSLWQQGQGDGKGCTFADRALYREVAIVLFDDAVCNRQSKSGTQALGGEKGIEDCFQVRLVNTRSGITDSNS